MKPYFEILTQVSLIRTSCPRSSRPPYHTMTAVTSIPGDWPPGAEGRKRTFSAFEFQNRHWKCKTKAIVGEKGLESLKPEVFKLSIKKCSPKCPDKCFKRK